MAERALLAGGRAFALPVLAEAVAPVPVTPLPLAAPGLLGLALIGGEAVPVLAPVAGLAGGPAWMRLPAGGVILAGDALLDPAPPGAEALNLPRIAPRVAPPARPAAGEGWAVPARTARGLTRSLAVETGCGRLVLPFAALEHLLPVPPLRPAPGMEGVALGYAIAEGAPVLVLDPAALAGGGRKVGEATLLVLFRHGGRRLGVPALRVAPAAPGEATVVARLDALLPRLGGAPLGSMAAPPVPEPARTILLCSAGGQAFALPVEDVAAVIPPLAPTPAPPGLDPRFRGVAAHRGDVLPVLDAGVSLGLPPVLAGSGQEAPLLRLALPRPVALAVAAVTGLRRVPNRLVSEVGGDGPVAAVAALGDVPLPICRAAVLGAPR
jgi:chemotaxis signal transduction protein